MASSVTLRGHLLRINIRQVENVGAVFLIFNSWQRSAYAFFAYPPCAVFSDSIHHPFSPGNFNLILCFSEKLGFSFPAVLFACSTFPKRGRGRLTCILRAWIVSNPADTGNKNLISLELQFSWKIKLIMHFYYGANEVKISVFKNEISTP